MNLMYFLYLLFFLNQVIAIQVFSSRIVSSTSKRVASTNSIYNIFSIFVTVISSIQIPLLASLVEKRRFINADDVSTYFHIILLFSLLGAILGAILIPNTQRLMTKLVYKLDHNETLLVLLVKNINIKNILLIFKHVYLPQKENFSRILNFKSINYNQIFINVVAYAITTGTTLACLYAGFLKPEFRVICLSLSSVVNGFGIFLMMLIIEPYNAVLTDRVINGEITHGFFRKHLTLVIMARIIGIFLSQLFLIPTSKIIVKIAELI